MLFGAGGKGAVGRRMRIFQRDVNFPERKSLICF